MKDLEKMLMSKKDKGEMSKEDIQAKMDVLMELMQMAREAMGSKVKSGMDEMNKVSVMAPDKEGLEEGLDKAKELMQSPMLEESEEEMEENPEEKKMEEPSMEEMKEESNLFSKTPSLEKKKKKLFSMMDEE